MIKSGSQFVPVMLALASYGAFPPSARAAHIDLGSVQLPGLIKFDGNGEAL